MVSTKGNMSQTVLELKTLSLKIIFFVTIRLRNLFLKPAIKRYGLYAIEHSESVMRYLDRYRVENKIIYVSIKKTLSYRRSMFYTKNISTGNKQLIFITNNCKI